MKKLWGRLLIAVALGVTLGLLAAGSAQAVSVTLSFSGTYTGIRAPIFGVFPGDPSVAVPYSYQITYDTALDTNAFFFATGASLGGETTTHEWHGYSASGVTATSLTFGSQTWTASDLSPAGLAIGVAADLWFDTDISLSTPTRSRIRFVGGSPGSGSLELGSVWVTADNIFMQEFSFVEDFADPFGNYASSTLMTIAAVPTTAVSEPATLAMVALSVLLALLAANSGAGVSRDGSVRDHQRVRLRPAPR